MKSKRNRGFSVVELLVTVGVIAILATITIGMSQRVVREAQLDSVINQFVADLAYARQLASRLNRYVAFSFDDAGTQYRILIQRRISDINVFDLDKDTDPNPRQPLGDSPFFENATSFAINSMGFVREFPLDVSKAQPISVTIDFVMIPRSLGREDMEWKKEFKIFSSGGYRIGPKIMK